MVDLTLYMKRKKLVSKSKLFEASPPPSPNNTSLNLLFCFPLMQNWFMKLSAHHWHFLIVSINNESV